ncbi:bifunctional phosphopantothenoylcysteine decarboxylase/phosphopantothenate--cysteine ligase CoaBC [Natronoglycomyces albus]|uniref:Coenzyme A biosynthesis bifunctional protein CoaBC n=1 Tax=Natronoglycomyces albus TaxID=2811108 RepID=A0A895XWM0_9ACTN|nr:bifunctional phosphopantothenoylcysteine decarboxylase/phosphopantothenate--cysteine ligase CoaBC [Natronoglycomyces albus]QSB06620.1 bifunctional phosphopantothenoylcysteine decarboxylase/phosphopantothenate--cysteine ligase CoaBC [Natronoglycomyces albus]
MRIVLGVAGGIAAFKACSLLRLYTESGHDVTVVPTEAALNFVGKATWEALSGRPVASDVFTDVSSVQHVQLGREADLVVIAPATADLLARAATGRADDLLTSTLLTATCPVVFAPAMHTEMWEHPATRANVDLLRERGNLIIEPATGRLTGADTGKGRLPEPEQIYAFTHSLLNKTWSGTDLAGLKVLVTAGGTREGIDPVRFIGNRSSGKQGFALAAAAATRGADVSLIAANVETLPPAGVITHAVETTEELRAATVRESDRADVVVLAAAPVDFRPARVSATKIKRGDDTTSTLSLVANPDIAAEIGRKKGEDTLLVIFAAETDDGLRHAAKKLESKKADLIVLNDVSGGAVFGSSSNAVTILDSSGPVASVSESTKEVVADIIWDTVAARLAR